MCRVLPGVHGTSRTVKVRAGHSTGTYLFVSGRLDFDISPATTRLVDLASWYDDCETPVDQIGPALGSTIVELIRRPQS